VIDAADERGVALLFSGVRHFRHRAIGSKSKKRPCAAFFMGNQALAPVHYALAAII